MTARTRAISMIELISAVALTALVVGGVAAVMGGAIQSQAQGMRQVGTQQSLNNVLSSLKQTSGMTFVAVLNPTTTRYGQSHGLTSTQVTLMYVDLARAQTATGSNSSSYQVERNLLSSGEMAVAIGGGSLELLPQATSAGISRQNSGSMVLGTSCGSDTTIYPARTVTLRLSSAGAVIERNLSGTTQSVSNALSGLRVGYDQQTLSLAVQGSDDRGERAESVSSSLPLPPYQGVLGSCVVTNNPASVAGVSGEGNWVHVNVRGVDTPVGIQISDAAQQQYANTNSSAYLRVVDGNVQVLPSSINVRSPSTFGAPGMRWMNAVASETRSAGSGRPITFPVRGQSSYVSVDYKPTSGSFTNAGTRSLTLTGPLGDPIYPERQFQVMAGETKSDLVPGEYLSEFSPSLLIGGTEALALTNSTLTDTGVTTAGQGSTVATPVHSGRVLNQAVGTGSYNLSPSTVNRSVSVGQNDARLTVTAPVIDSAGKRWGTGPKGTAANPIAEDTLVNCSLRTRDLQPPELQTTRTMPQYNIHGVQQGTYEAKVTVTLKTEEVGCATLYAQPGVDSTDAVNLMRTDPQAAACNARTGTYVASGSMEVRRLARATALMRLVSTPADAPRQANGITTYLRPTYQGATPVLATVDCNWREIGRTEEIEPVPYALVEDPIYVPQPQNASSTTSSGCTLAQAISLTGPGVVNPKLASEDLTEAQAGSSSMYAYVVHFRFNNTAQGQTAQTNLANQIKSNPGSYGGGATYLGENNYDPAWLDSYAYVSSMTAVSARAMALLPIVSSLRRCGAAQTVSTAPVTTAIPPQCTKAQMDLAIAQQSGFMPDRVRTAGMAGSTTYEILGVFVDSATSDIGARIKNATRDRPDIYQFIAEDSYEVSSGLFGLDKSTRYRVWFAQRMTPVEALRYEQTQDAKKIVACDPANPPVASSTGGGSGGASGGGASGGSGSGSSGGSCATGWGSSSGGRVSIQQCPGSGSGSLDDSAQAIADGLEPVCIQNYQGSTRNVSYSNGVKTTVNISPEQKMC